MNTLLLTIALSTAQVSELPLLELTADDTRVSESVRIVIPAGTVIPDANGDGVLHVVADDVKILFESGSILRGAAEGIAPDQLSGVGVRIEGHSGVRIAGLNVRGYKVGLFATGADELVLADADLSDNFALRLRSTPEHYDDGADWLACHDNDENEWLERYGAGAYIENSSEVIVRGSRARRTQNGLLLDRVDSAQIYDNDFSFLSGWGLGLWRSSDNVVVRNAFDFCIRGYSHGIYNRGQDSAGILVFEQCSGNVFALNSATHGGDGVFGFAGREALGQRESQARGFDATRRGNNDNLFFANDFSFAAAHGLEMTFSFGNVVESNRFKGNAICGIWGGYSRGMLIQDNLFEENGDAGYGSERGGVNIEHAVESWIVGNQFVRNACGVHLWWDADEDLAATPWAQANLISCEQNAIVGNTFAGDELAIQLRLCKPTIVRKNEMVGVKAELEAADGALSSLALPKLPAPQSNLRFVGSNKPVGARKHLEGRDKIVMGELGPWDHESPFVQLLERRADRHIYALHQFADDVVPSVVGKDVLLEVLDGTPRRVQLTCTGKGLFPYSLSVGEQRRSGVLERVAWEIACFVLAADPREDETSWHVAAAQAAPQMREVLDLDYAQGGPADLGFEVAEGVGRDQFGTLACATVALPAGRYQLTTHSDDGVRVYVDGERLIDNWTWHPPAEDKAEFVLEAAGEVELRVEHFELDGYALLQLRLSPLR